MRGWRAPPQAEAQPSWWKRIRREAQLLDTLVVVDLRDPEDDSPFAVVVRCGRTWPSDIFPSLSLPAAELGRSESWSAHSPQLNAIIEQKVASSVAVDISDRSDR